ncbi:aminopeptidase P N-terminal domain-containing protein [Pokkaliibacter sp. CJK22405]|uniref:aminopeptidase P N-terminal domain-containing protein n=1 Tax=Pokkaliibacter sp. CJK22405 TaxID=3384615 RepID=UPI0039846EB0
MLKMPELWEQQLQECADRRERLMEKMAPDSLLILAGAELQRRNSDVDYYFRQDSDFAYLSEFHEPGAWLVLAPGREEGEFLLFCPDRDPATEQWTGYRLGVEGCEEELDADQAFTLDELEELMPELMLGITTLYTSWSSAQDVQPMVQEWLKSARSSARGKQPTPVQWLNSDDVLHPLRLIKSPFEQSLMRTAGNISAEAHIAAMKASRAGLAEFQLEAELHYHFAKQGARWPAYDSIVGGGANACILHYLNNDQPLVDGDMVLIDAGAEWQGYAGDITRTFPINGRFSPTQRLLYERVLKVEKACIEAARPGVTVDSLQRLAARMLCDALLELGILEGKLETLIKEEAYRPYYMHSIGHWLGRDVHDVGAYRVAGESVVLQPGMVMTIEPGLYLPLDDENLAPQWRGLGIRIEDNILITETGAEVLTGAVPVDPDEIEALMAKA